MNNNLNDSHPIEELNTNLKKVIDEVKESLKDNFSYEAKLIKNQNDLIKEAFIDDKENVIKAFTFISVSIKSIPQNIKNKKDLIGKASKNGLNKLFNLYKESVKLKEEMASSLIKVKVEEQPKWEELKAQQEQKFVDILKNSVLPNKVEEKLESTHIEDGMLVGNETGRKFVIHEDGTIEEMGYTPTPNDVPYTFEDLVKETNNPVIKPTLTPEPQVINELPTVNEVKQVAEEHPINIVDAFKNIIEEKKLSFEAWKLSGQIKMIEIKNIIIAKIIDTKDNFIIKIDNSKKDLIKKAFYGNQEQRIEQVNKIEEKKTEVSSLQAKLDALKAKVRTEAPIVEEVKTIEEKKDDEVVQPINEENKIPNLNINVEPIVEQKDQYTAINIDKELAQNTFVSTMEYDHKEFPANVTFNVKDDIKDMPDSFDFKIEETTNQNISFIPQTEEIVPIKVESTSEVSVEPVIENVVIEQNDNNIDEHSKKIIDKVHAEHPEFLTQDYYTRHGIMSQYEIDNALSHIRYDLGANYLGHLSHDDIKENIIDKTEEEIKDYLDNKYIETINNKEEKGKTL